MSKQKLYPSTVNIFFFDWICLSFGTAENGSGEDLHGAGAVRFDKKTIGTGQGEERVLNNVRLVRNIK